MLLLLLGCEWFICPTDAFPLNDDWSYTYSVNRFNDTGIIDIGYWPAMNLVGHILWGSLFTKLFGFSHFILRCSTLFLSTLTLLLFYRQVVNSSKNHTTAFFVTLFVFFNPIWFLLSNTFMTDVPFLFSIILSFFCVQKIVVQKKNLYIIPFTLVCVYSILIRQFGIALSASLLIASAINAIKDKRNSTQLLVDTIPFLVSIITYMVFEKWIAQRLLPYAAYQSTDVVTKNSMDLFMSIGDNMLRRYSSCMLYIGLFLCPLCIIAAIAFLKKKPFKHKLATIFLMALLLFFAVNRIAVFPIGNIVYNAGLGVESLYDITILNINTYHASSDAFLFVIKLIAILGLMGLVIILGFGMLHFVIMVFKKVPVNKGKLFLVIFSILYFLLLCISKSFFDRYSLPLIATVLLLMAPYIQLNAVKSGILVLFLLGSGSFSVLSTSDYFNWNRARWSLINNTIKSGVDPFEINGGFEYTASVFYHKSWWDLWVGDKSPYKVTFGNIPNHTLVNYTTYRRYIPFKTDTVFLYRNNNNH
ncbi:MAG: phospholipid carrier-dependent glycosyltransferase [Bacteroidota bacterium]